MPSTAPTFSERLNGRFSGMVRQEDANRLASAIAEVDGWYLLEPQGHPVSEPVDGQTASHHLQQLLQEILDEERGVWSTLVYVQSQEDPWIIKVFHPRRAGCGCGSQGGIMPWWILSRFPPEGLSCTLEESKPVGGGWWRTLF